MHKSHINVKNPQEASLQRPVFKWELFPYSFAVIGFAGISGCSGLSAWLEYNEGKVQGCFDVPISGVPVPPEKAAISQEFCLPTSEGPVYPTP